MKRWLAAMLLLCGVYLALLFPFTRAMAHKPYVEKLGAVPRPEVLQALLPDYQELTGASLLTKVFLYFGGLVEAIDDPRQLVKATDYPAMSRTVHAALRLDPYNADGYYFGQAILAWDVGQYQLANELLEYGMQYRTWDWQLPFFAGFNYVYFLKDRPAAAAMYMRAGELSGQALFKTLAGRYLQEAGETRMAIDYLRTMAADAGNPAVQRALQLRIAAFEGVLAIEQARDRFTAEHGGLPASVEALVAAGYLSSLPLDPYGGSFYLDDSGQVASTSRFAFAGQAQGRKQNPPTTPREAAP